MLLSAYFEHARPSAADNPEVLRGCRVTSGRRMIVNSGRSIVHPLPCCENSDVLSVAYG